jgi:hypothetical protein
MSFLKRLSAAEAEPMEIECDGMMACPTCGRDLRGNFCADCGEKRFDAHHLTVKHLLEQVVEVFTHADNRFIRSVKLLITRPGFLTNEYIKGSRKPYLQPVQLFLVANLLFFLVQTFSVLAPLTTPLIAHVHGMPWSRQAQEKVQQELSRRHVTMEEYSVRFDIKEETEAKTLVIVMVPFFAAILAVIYFFHQRMLVKHLVFSFHFYAFALLVLTGIGLLASLAALVTSGTLRSAPIPEFVFIPRIDYALTAFVAGVCALYLFFSIRTVYENGRMISIVLASILVGVLFAILEFYRLFLFYVTVHALG